MPAPQNLREFFHECAASSNKQGVLAFPEKPENYAGLRFYTNEEIHSYVQTTIHYYLDQQLAPAPNTDSVAGIFAPGTLEWLVTAIALARLGYTILALSRRLTDETLSALLAKANCHLLITDHTFTQPLSSSATTTPTTIIPIIPLPTLLSPPPHVRQLAPVLSLAPTPTNALIWHSSGSTGVPKLLPLTQPAVMARLTSTATNPVSSGNAWIASAAYNSAGLTMLFSALAKPAGNWSAFFNDRLPYTGEGLEAFVGELRANGIEKTTFTPATLEMLMSRPKGVELLKGLPYVSSFGALCPQEVGDRLVRAGVFFRTGYAMSEAGSLLSSGGREKDDLDWDFMGPMLPGVKEHVWFKPLLTSAEESAGASNGDGGGLEQLYELVILQGLPNCPPKFSNSDDPPGSFYTGDVFVKHPTKEFRWKIVGRKDDQINMAFPAVVNALDYEDVVKSACPNSDIDEVVLFGQGREKLGLLVFVLGQNGIDEKEIQRAVWEAVETRINGNDKFKLRVEEPMIRIVRGQVPRTDKQNFMRAAVYRQFRDTIDGMYR